MQLLVSEYIDIKFKSIATWGLWLWPLNEFCVKHFEKLVDFFSESFICKDNTAGLENYILNIHRTKYISFMFVR